MGKLKQQTLTQIMQKYWSLEIAVIKNLLNTDASRMDFTEAHGFFIKNPFFSV